MKKYLGACVLIGLVVAAVMVWFGFMVQIADFRWTSAIPDGFGGFSSHQWGILLSGLVGATAGAAVAMLVLLGTIRAQSKWNAAIMRQSGRHLVRTLEQQRELHAAEQQAALERDREERAITALVEWTDLLRGIDVTSKRSEDEAIAFERVLTRPIGPFMRAPKGWAGMPTIVVDVASLFRAAYRPNSGNGLIGLRRLKFQGDLQQIGRTLSAWDKDDPGAHDTLRSVAKGLHALNDLLSEVKMSISLRTPAPPLAP